MNRTVSAWVTSDEEFLGATGPFPVDVPWWSEVEPVTARLEEMLGVPVLVLRLLSVDGGAHGRDGHVTYHVEALKRPLPGLLDQRTVDRAVLNRPDTHRSPWARADGLRELLDGARRMLDSAGRPVTGPVEQRRTWNLAGIFRLPTAQGPVWLKATSHFAADEAAVISTFAEVNPSLVPALLGSGERHILMEHVPGEDCWQASPEIVTSGMHRFVAAQAALAGSTTSVSSASPRPAGLRDWSAPALAARIRDLLDGPVTEEITSQELTAARELAGRWALLAECGLPNTVVHGDFHCGNWRSDGGPPVIMDFADAYWGHPVMDGLRVHDFLPESAGATAAVAWIDAWKAQVPGSDPARALALAEPLAHLTQAVRYQEFLDNIEPTERVYHQGDPASAIREAVRSAESPHPLFTFEEIPANR